MRDYQSPRLSSGYLRLRRPFKFQLSGFIPFFSLHAPCAASSRPRLGVINRDMLYKHLQSRWAKFRGKEDPNAPIGLRHDKRLEHGDEFWALRNVDLEVKEGEILGIIGRNGAGFVLAA